MCRTTTRERRYAMPEVDMHHAVTEHVGAYVRAAGAGEPVVCLHSSASSSAQWRPLIERLSGRFRMLAVDLYGSGRSPAWPGERPLSLADEVALLEPIL